MLKGDGYRIGGGISPYLSHPPSLRQDAYSTRRLQEPPLRAPRDVVILNYFFEPTRARRAPAAAGPGTHPKKETGDGTFATPARTRPKREAARGGRGAEKVGRAVGRGHAAARARQGAHGRAGHREGARDRCRLRPDAIAPRPGRFRRLTRGPSSGPPDARPARQSDAAPQLRRAASRGAARRGRAAGALGRPSRGASRVFAALAALTGPKRWLCARAAPALAERSVAQGF
mgnify:CR=1 FL=1